MKRVLGISIFVMFFLIFISTLIALKQKFMEMKVARLNKEIYKNYEVLQTLKAEWHYLNNKEYLQMLVKKHYPELIKEVKPSDVSLLRERKQIPVATEDNQ